MLKEGVRKHKTHSAELLKMKKPPQSKSGDIQLKQYQLDLILNLISYAQSDKEGFMHYLNIILAKYYPKEKIEYMIEELRKDINIQKFK